jgi:hypothetical protein
LSLEKGTWQRHQFSQQAGTETDLTGFAVSIRKQRAFTVLGVAIFIVGFFFVVHKYSISLPAGNKARLHEWPGLNDAIPQHPLFNGLRAGHTAI